MAKHQKTICNCGNGPLNSSRRNSVRNCDCGNGVTRFYYYATKGDRGYKKPDGGITAHTREDNLIEHREIKTKAPASNFECPRCGGMLIRRAGIMVCNQCGQAVGLFRDTGGNADGRPRGEAWGGNRVGIASTGEHIEHRHNRAYPGRRRVPLKFEE